MSRKKKDIRFRAALNHFEIHFGKESAEELMQEFVTAVREILEQLDIHIKKRNAETIRAHTHRLIGLAPIFKAEALSTSSQEIEKALVSKDWASVDKYYREIQVSFSKFVT